MADNSIQKASWEVVNAVREANQAVANSMVTIQEGNLKFAQSVLLNWTDLLESQTGDMHHLAQEWGQHIQKQQEAFQKVGYAMTDLSMNFLRTWFSFSQQIWGAMHATSERDLQLAQKAA